MKRLPLEFYQKARAAKRKRKVDEQTEELSGENSSPQIFLNFEDSQDEKRASSPNMTMDTFNVTMLDMKNQSSTAEIENKTSSLYKWRRLLSVPDKVNTWDMIKYEGEAFLSPMNDYLGYDDSNMGSQNFSSKALFGTKKDNAILDAIKRRIEQKKVSFNPPIIKKKEKERQVTKDWALKKVKFLGSAINSLKQKTVKDIE